MIDLLILHQAQVLRIAESCAYGLERHIEKLLEHPRVVSQYLAEVPIVGGPCPIDTSSISHGLKSYFMTKIVAALIATERFRQDWLGWPQPLPVHPDDCEKMQGSALSPRSRIVGYFGESLRSTDPAYDYDRHPRFDVFVRGLMAYQSTPIEIRNDRELQGEFPAMPLDGLQDGLLAWRTDEKIAFDRDAAARVAAFEAERATWR
jgi:hypothetical protein